MAGTVTVDDQQRGILHNSGTTVVMVKSTCVADDSDGSYPDTEISNVGGYLIAVYVKPGTTTPTTAMDLTVKMDGIDLLGGTGADIDTSKNTLITPQDTALNIIYPPFVGPLTQSLSGNSVNSADVEIFYFFSA